MFFSRQNKCYLTGIDWIIHAFDYMNRQATGAGNMSQIILELNGVLPEEEFRRCLADFVKNYPVLEGRLKRDYNLAPYWKFYPQDNKSQIRIKVHHLDSNAVFSDVFSLLEKSVNIPFGVSREYLAFSLIYLKEKTYLAMIFDHCLFDARGAEAFLGMFEQAQKEGIENLPEVSLNEPARLCRWGEKFKAGRQVNRMFLNLAENSPPRVFPLPAKTRNRKFKFKMICFDEYQASAIIEKAYNEAGYLFFMPYALAVVTMALHEIFTGRGLNRGDYVIPVSIDRRSLEKVDKEVFFNHVSFLFFKIQAEEVRSFSRLLETIKQQMYKQVKSGLSRDIQEASFLMRIVPLRVLSFLMRLPLKGEVGSFSFSCVGESAYGFSRFMDKRVCNIFHTPRVPVPPGLGIFFNQFQGKLNMVISYLDGIVSDDEINIVEGFLRSQLETKVC